MPAVNMLEASLAVLVVIDVQEKLLTLIDTARSVEMIDRTVRLIEAAKILDIPILYTEQYPKGLGHTDPRIREHLPSDQAAISKTTCSCWRSEAFRDALQETRREHVILTGQETHICIQQTAMDLIRVDYIPFVAADAVASRRPNDGRTALERMRNAGAEITTSESILFELIERCDHPRFKDILKWVK